MIKTQSIPPRELPRVAWQRLVRELRTRTAPRRPHTLEIGGSIEEIARGFRRRKRPRFFSLAGEHALMIAQFFPEAADLAIEEADRVMAHRFDLLGSGEVHLGDAIDWHLDFQSGHRWPVEHHTRLALTSPGGRFDVKIPWELSRFHHGIRLGQAYLYTQDERYAAELVAQISHWITSNPYEFGVNWAGPMDVAIRAVNWIWAIYAIFESDALSEPFLAVWLASLKQHGEYLAQHLEDGWPRTNHLIANLAGLAYLGILFPEFKEAARWKEIALTRLTQEMDRQIYADGVDYEASVSYHRLVTEMVLSVAALALINGIALPEPTIARLRAMLDVIMAYTQPDGLAPQIGDADDGRLHPLTVHRDPVRTARDHRHLLALGSLVLERESPEWAGYIDPLATGWSVTAGHEWQDAFWCFPVDAAARYTDLVLHTTTRPEGVEMDSWVEVLPGMRVRARALARRALRVADIANSRGFEAGGWYIMRHQDLYMAIDAGEVGQQGAGGHAHNDTLSLTVCAYSQQFLVDPGSYLYTSNPEMRNLFRSTAYHNTLQIGDEEINGFPENGELFRLKADAHVTVHRWISQPAYDLLDASHDGYSRLHPSVIHHRQIWFDKIARLWILHDNVSLSKAHHPNPADSLSEVQINLHFHFAPLPVRIDRGNNAAVCEGSAGAGLLVMPLGEFPLRASLEDAWHSPRYGVRQRSPVVKFTGRVRLPADLVLILYPHQAAPDFQVVRAAGRNALTNFRRMWATSVRTPGVSGRLEPV